MDTLVINLYVLFSEVSLAHYTFLFKAMMQCIICNFTSTASYSTGNLSQMFFHYFSLATPTHYSIYKDQGSPTSKFFS